VKQQWMPVKAKADWISNGEGVHLSRLVGPAGDTVVREDAEKGIVWGH